MNIRINGAIRHIDGQPTVADLLAEMKLPKDGVAVAVNSAVIPRAEHASTHLQENDTVEIIHAVGGGAGDAILSAAAGRDRVDP